MDKNMGTTDRTLRTAVVAPAALVVAWLIGIGSFAGIILVAVAAVMLATSAMGRCPLYSLFGISTCASRDGRPATRR